VPASERSSVRGSSGDGNQCEQHRSVGHCWRGPRRRGRRRRSHRRLLNGPVNSRDQRLGDAGLAIRGTPPKVGPSARRALPTQIRSGSPAKRGLNRRPVGQARGACAHPPYQCRCSIGWAEENRMASPLPLRGITVLVVEDDHTTLKAFSQVIAQVFRLHCRKRIVLGSRAASDRVGRKDRPTFF